MQPVFIGDETTAAGYRLAGLAVRVAGPEQAAAELAAARRDQPPLILITAECAEAIAVDELDAALRAFAPPVAIVPDSAGRAGVPDFVRRVRLALGIAA